MESKNLSNSNVGIGAFLPPSKIIKQVPVKVILTAFKSESTCIVQNDEFAVPSPRIKT